MSTSPNPVIEQHPNQGSFVEGKDAADAPSEPAHSRVHPSRDLSAEEKAHVSEIRKLWQTRETTKAFDPMSLIERTGITFVPSSYTKDSFEKLQKLFVDEVLRLQADMEAEKAAKAAGISESDELKSRITQLESDKSAAEEALAEVQAQKVAVFAQVNALKTQLDATNSRASAAETAVTALKAELQAAKQQHDVALEAAVTDAKSKAARDVEALRQENATMKASIASLNAAIESVKQNNATQADAAAAQAAALKSELAKALAAVSTATAVPPPPVPSSAVPAPTTRSASRQRQASGCTTAAARTPAEKMAASRRTSEISSRSAAAVRARPPVTPILPRNATATATATVTAKPTVTTAGEKPPSPPAGLAVSSPMFMSPTAVGFGSPSGRSKSSMRARRPNETLSGTGTSGFLRSPEPNPIDSRPPWKFYASHSEARADL